MNVLVFGDSNACDFLRMQKGATIKSVHVERYDGLALGDAQFSFLFDVALADDDYNVVLLSIGTNDFGKTGSKSKLQEEYESCRKCFASRNDGSKLFIIGPHSADFDTAECDTIDGVHFTAEAQAAIGCAIMEQLRTKEEKIAENEKVQK